MGKITVDTGTLLKLSDKVKKNNNKLLSIVTDIKDMTVYYNDMLISDAGELFKEVVIKEQEQEQKKILENDQLIAEKLSSFAKIYGEAFSKIERMTK